jgi:hypothetical protein
MLLIIAGVIGGLIGFGVLGLFVGPVILAASYTLMRSWIGGHLDAERARSAAEASEKALEAQEPSTPLRDEHLPDLPLPR